MKKFFGEFKKFITRGNVLDMAVGVIIGSAFTAIVTALTSNILQPFINWIIYLISGSKGSGSDIYTFLVGSSTELADAIYIDWGKFITAIINFILIAFVLFMIIKTINKVNEHNEKLTKKLKKVFPTKQEKKEMKEKGLNYRSLEDVKKFREQKDAELLAQKQAEELAKKLAEEEAKKHTTEGLLESILQLLSYKKTNKQKEKKDE